MDIWIDFARGLDFFCEEKKLGFNKRFISSDTIDKERGISTSTNTRVFFTQVFLF
jgi:hypothetical protein